MPSGLTLTSGGLLSGTVSGLASDTSYSFTVVATDAELQDSPRAFTVNIAASDTYFNLTTLLINGDTAPNVLTDSSNNNFNLIAYGSTRASNFTPYGTGWSNYFDGSNGYLNVSNTGLFGSGDWTLELWINAPVGQSDKPIIEARNAAGGVGTSTGFTLTMITSTEIRVYSGSEVLRTTVNYVNQWVHIALVKSGSITTMYCNGVSAGTTTSIGNMSDTSFIVGAGYYGVASLNVYGNFYLSNLRVVKGVAVYTGAFTPPTQPLAATQSSGTNISAITGTQTVLLTCSANRFIDTSSNNFTVTRSGGVAVRSFNPFNITNTGISGSMYFD
ncbi:MAG: hypothetical protein EBS54_09245, partial [Betaproteobacteria bacterium]|nr:hypothetical protein [Betaproteobacteria bacterium]